MPRRGHSNIGRHSQNATRHRNVAARWSEEERGIERESARIRMSANRERQSQEIHEAYIDQQRLRRREVRARLNDERRSQRATIERQRRQQQIMPLDIERAAFRYDPNIQYSAHPSIQFGQMSVVCQHCNALKFQKEPPGLCCAGGKVKLPQLLPPPEPLRTLLYGESPNSNHFLQHIKMYNDCFQMTSFGAEIVSEQRYNPTFKIHGQIFHRAGSLLPHPDQEHKYLQIYFLGDSNYEVNRRCTIFNTTKRELVQQLQQMLHEHNELIKLFATSLEQMPSDDYCILIKADKRPAGTHERLYNAPTVSEIAIVIVGENLESRDIVIKRRTGNAPQRISETHRSYDALQYPLMFCRGEDGYHFGYNMINPANGVETNKKVSSMNFYSYRMMIRLNIDNHLLRYRRLFQQYAVDMYVKVETGRLNYIRFNQDKLRSEEYIHLRDAVNSDADVADIGRLTILPSTYIGSPRHMHEYSQDAMTYVRNYGRPDLFVTFTCNPKWPEITQLLLPGQTPSDRHDVTARVFKQKLRCLMDFITKQRVYGTVRCWMYSVEWQKRGLPHAHILLWLVDKITPDQIDDIISAEIPDPEVDPELHEVVKTNMIHGPCGQHNPTSVCMSDSKCTKRYPRAFISETQTGNDGYPLYRRRSPQENGRTFVTQFKGANIVVDNTWIVPYSPILSKTFKTHINVEYCNSVKSIKYVCKYVTKGSDMAVIGVERDEISKFQMGRYVNCNEALWRLFSFAIHERHPTVVHLSVHLENGQRVYFNTENAAQRAECPPATTLTSFFSTCASDQFARTLLYSEMPRYYTWNTSSKKWLRRKQGQPVDGYPGVFSTDALGRIYTIHPKNDDCFYLRLLLINVRGPVSFESLRTVDGTVCATFREACQQLQLLEHDNHWNQTLDDAIASSPANGIRTLFAMIISICQPSNPCQLWDTYKDAIAEDILHRFRMATGNFELQMNDDIYNEALVLIEDLCLLMSGKLLIDIHMPAPNRQATNVLNCELERERAYDTTSLQHQIQINVPLLNEQQKSAYDQLMKAVDDANGGLFFLDAPGGTGKTFLISLILAAIRAQSGIALALASTGISATLLEGGRTAHSALKLPLNLQINENPVCNISKQSAMAKVLKNCKLIIWDECTMAHKRSLEALDRTLKDLRNNNRRFGGVMILLAGDFRQTLPVIPKSTAADELNACLKSSYLWRYVTTIPLNINMRVFLQQDSTAENFSKELLRIGNGQIPVNASTGLISIPPNICKFTSTKDELITNVYPNITQNFRNYDWLSERAILSAKNIDVNDLNWTIQNKIPGELRLYKSIDRVENEDDVVNYPVEFLNSLDFPGMPPHHLRLKVGSVVIMLRNLHAPKLCNGTRLVVTKLMNNMVVTNILKGPFKGEECLIPRIPLTSSDLPFQFKRIQFPLKLAFAMTINKSQGQSLEVCGINLESSCFSHGQLYVACSRVGKPSSLFIYAPEQKTKNVVYRAALH